MLQLLWGVINLFLILSFFYFLIGLVVKGRKFLEPYPRIFTVPVLVLGVFAFLESSSNKEKSIPSYKGLATMEVIDVSKNLTNMIQLNLVRDKVTGEIFEEGSHSFLQGFVLGLKWKHQGVIKKGNELHIHGMLVWKLFPVEVYGESKEFIIPDNYPESF